jgi:hypothetical protein
MTGGFRVRGGAVLLTLLAVLAGVTVGSVRGSGSGWITSSPPGGRRSSPGRPTSIR